VDFALILVQKLVSSPIFPFFLSSARFCNDFGAKASYVYLILSFLTVDVLTLKKFITSWIMMHKSKKMS
jgi:hypothetical protein